MLKAFCYAASLAVLLLADAEAASAKVDVKKPVAQQVAQVRKELDGGTKYSRSVRKIALRCFLRSRE